MAAQRPYASHRTESGALRRPFDVHRFALVVLLAAAALAVTYLLAANLLLRTRLLREVLSEGNDVELDYASAYSVWPGLVHVRNFHLEVQDHDVQLSVAADSGVIAISLHELPFRRFHATHVDVRGLSYRFRHKVTPAAARSARVAAYPTILGFPDPPIYGGEQPPVESVKDVWQLTIDGIGAELREIWIQEYRYVGGGRLSGGFQLEPSRRFRVSPSLVTLDHGELSVGDMLATAHLQLSAGAHIEDTSITSFDPDALVEHITGHVMLAATGVNLAALDSRASERESWRASGRAELDVSASLTRGRIDASSSAELRAEPFTLTTPVGKLSGAMTSRLDSASGGRLEWLTTSPALTLANASPQQGPVLGSPRLAISLSSDVLAAAPGLRAAELDAPRIVVPSLGWAQRWMQRAGAPIEIDGKLEGRAHLAWVPHQGPRARVHLTIADATLGTEGVSATLGGRVDAEVEPTPGQPNSSSGRAEIALDGVEVRREKHGKPSAKPIDKPFRAVIDLGSLKLAFSPEAALSANVNLDVDPADSLLSLALGSPLLQDLATDVFALRRLEASAHLHVSGRAVRVELARAESGALTGAGYWQRPAAGGADGAFLISSKVANVGISLSGTDTATNWFVPDDWLASRGLARGERSPVRLYEGLAPLLPEALMAQRSSASAGPRRRPSRPAPAR